MARKLHHDGTCSCCGRVGPTWDDLTAKLDALTPLHGEAILCAVRWTWRNPDAWDHSKDEWWTPAFRLAKAAE